MVAAAARPEPAHIAASATTIPRPFRFMNEAMSNR
jgi:hypothetical protein